MEIWRKGPGTCQDLCKRNVKPVSSESLFKQPQFEARLEVCSWSITFAMKLSSSAGNLSVLEP